MKVVLLADVKGTGQKDDLVNVSDGYARNYLLPRKLAVVADNKVLNELKTKNEAKEHKRLQEIEEAKRLASIIDKKDIYVEAKAGTSGRLFGAITSKEIADSLSEQFNVSVDKKKVEMDDVKQIGVYDAVVKLAGGISATVRVNVVQKEK
ncbi:MAG: 50S ribosomal protein L9 [Oscillospiraceae bacterium]|nr:50S ribosomal protein L9 [Oscillospiraceae bacterium]